MSFYSLLQAIRLEDISNVSLLFNASYAHKTEGGWTALHWACWYNNSSDIVHFLIDEGCDQEAETSKLLGQRRRPLHLAAMKNHVDTVKLLISKGCLLNMKDRDGITPLCAAMKRGNADCVLLIRSAMLTNIEMIQPFEMSRSLKKLTKKQTTCAQVSIIEDLELIKNNHLFKITNVVTGRTVLDDLMAKNNARIVLGIKSKPIDHQELEDWLSLTKEELNPHSLRMLQECLLYRCIEHNYQVGFVSLCTPDVVNGPHLFMGPTALETATEFGRVLFVKDILSRLVDVDESWKKAVNVADAREYHGIASLIRARKIYLNRRYKKGYSRLHVAVFDNEPLVVEHILQNDLIDSDVGDKTIGSALSSACEMDHVLCVEAFEKYNVNTNTVNKLKQSPLNIAIEKRMEDHYDFLVDKAVHLESVDHMGFTALQRSVLHDCEWICDRLVKNGSRVDQYYDIDLRLLDIDPDFSMVIPKPPKIAISNRETIFSICVKVNGSIYPCLFNSINQKILTLTDANGNTLLHTCAAALLPTTCRKLLSIKNNVNVTNEDGCSPLMELLKCNNTGGKSMKAIVDTVDVLVAAGASFTMKDLNECCILQRATELHSEELLLAMTHKREDIEFLPPPVWRTWNTLYYFKFIKDVLPLVNKTLLKELITDDDITSSINNADIDIAKALFDKAKHEIRITVVEKFLYRASSDCDKVLFRELVEHEITRKISPSNGEPLLHCILKDQKKDFSAIILRSRNAATWLNRKNSVNQLPIHLFIELEYWDMMADVIDKTTSVDEADEYGFTPLSLLLLKLTDKGRENDKIMKCLKRLIFKVSTIYTQQQFDHQVNIRCTNYNLKEEVKSLWGELSISKVCPICASESKDCSLTCGHVFCNTCAHKVSECYICRLKITERNPVYL